MWNFFKGNIISVNGALGKMLDVLYFQYIIPRIAVQVPCYHTHRIDVNSAIRKELKHHVIFCLSTLTVTMSDIAIFPQQAKSLTIDKYGCCNVLKIHISSNDIHNTLK